MSEFDNIKVEPIDVQDAQIDAVNEQQVQIRFRPVPGANHLPVAPTNTFSVPTRLSRLGLSELLNHILELSPPRPFEFLINNKFLRVPLATYLTNHDLSIESDLEIQYLEATPPPNRDQSTPHPDWVSSVDACLGVVAFPLPAATEGPKAKAATKYTAQESILSVVGCYDHIVRVWAHSMDSEETSAKATTSTTTPAPFVKSTHSLVAQGAGHYGPVTSVRVARPFVRSMTGAPALMVSGSHDKTARLWSLAPPQHASQSSSESAPKASRLTCLGVFDYHVGTVTAVETQFHPNRPRSLLSSTVDASLDKVRFITAGYDGVAAVWSNAKEYVLDQDTVMEKYSLMNKGMGRKLKAQRTAMEQSASKVTGTVAAELEVPHYRPVNAYVGHRGAISSVLWPNEQHFYTGGYDCTIRLWDTERSQYLHAWSGGHVVNSLDFNTPLNLIASGDQDGFVRLWDPRVSNNALGGQDSDDDEETATRDPITRTNRGQFRACNSWVSSVKWLPSILNSPYYLCTTGYDGKSKLWDIRSSKPLHEMDSNSERLLCGDFVPAVAPSAGQIRAGVYQICGGTGKQLDRLHWNINVQ